ncbi:MAG: hypothetical protein HGA36_00190 [Candidatus Moranbacteria bacterium]|nr:hypothetical protein [Candidatus Moranbacteria bacterium]
MNNIDILREVETNYKDNFERLEDKKFHFAARLFLWFGDEFAKNKLAELQAEYIGKNEQEYSEKITEILKEDSSNEGLLFKNERAKFFNKYPLLKRYNKILFRNLFCQIIYGINLKPVISKQINKEDLIDLKNALLHDSEAIATLSTHAINYFYTLDYYLNEEESFLDPALFLDIVKNKKNSILKVYLLTHCIIGESAFYSRAIKRNLAVYDKMFIELETIIANDYAEISLDNKVEFLVCAKLCQKKSILKEKILLDTVLSFDSNNKCFIENSGKKLKDTFRKGEHRNVLALMAFYSEKTSQEA